MKINPNDSASTMTVLLAVASEQMAGTSMTQLAITDKQPVFEMRRRLVERAFERAHALIAEYNRQQEEPKT